MTAAETLTSAIAAACGPGSGLTDVTLGISGALPACVARALPGSASQLTALTIRPLPGQPPPSLSWAHLTHLRYLSSLVLTADFGQLAGPPAGLSQLGLTRLRLHGVHLRAGGRPTGPPEVGPALLACPTALRRLELAAVHVLCCEREAGSSGRGGNHRAQPGAAGDNGHGAMAAPPAQLAGHAAAAAAVAAGGPAFLPAAADGLAPGAAQQARWRDSLSRMRMVGQGQELAAGLRERWQGLEALRLHNVDVAREVLTVLPSLPCLTSLHLTPRRGSSEAILEAQRCSSLQELTLAPREYRLPALPPGALPQLTRLRISGSEELMKLHPSWCMLPTLQSFELESCEQLVDLPVELSALDQLERLSFSHQRMERLPWMLTGLSQLTRLAVAACSLESLPEGPYLRSLHELVLFANNLSCVPPALAHPEWRPTNIRQLDLSSNYSHHLSAADVGVLRTLSTLEVLNLRRQLYSPEDAHPQEQLAALHAALPGCDILV
ncbi:hypothetical protein ABPG77_009680 [Micractinium sp. CCAP 211/92]